ncbi:hypothetical protein PGT21_004010 [Puccinia graminis f. sp. tritici]|uniref:Uncharacterized protein n=1 Tax=Puccinia graminis f. sp. tritici TaxID=56615 RepID=A0A5B0Q1R1_PUCGR|nr:hypothetical protein PGT21_004010 [Puccinia graminis f. sp. tritici]
MDLIPGIGIGSLHPIQSQCIGQLGLGGAIRYRYLVLVWMIPKCKAYSPQHLGAGSGLQCNPDPDPIPWDWITLSNPIPYFLIPGIEKLIRSDKLADTVLDWICFTVEPSLQISFESHEKLSFLEAKKAQGLQINSPPSNLKPKFNPTPFSTPKTSSPIPDPCF